MDISKENYVAENFDKRNKIPTFFSRSHWRASNHNHILTFLKMMVMAMVTTMMMMAPIVMMMMMMIVMMGCTQIPISTLSHIWVFVRLYGIVYVIIVIIIIIIMII